MKIFYERNTMKVGLVGLGNLGTAIAKRLLECGHELISWNRSLSNDLSLIKVETPQELAQQVDIILVCVFDSRAVKSVLTMEHGLLSADVKGKILIDFTTNHFDEVAILASLCSEHNLKYLECPILGSVNPAANGMLTILTGGDNQAYQKVKPILDSLAKTQFYFSEYGLATKLKIINNMVLGDMVAVLAEALVLGEKIGIEKKQVLDILSSGAGNSAILNAKRDKFIQGDFKAHFSVKAVYKDTLIAEELAETINAKLTYGIVNKSLYNQAIRDGFGDEDIAAIYKIFKSGENS